MCIRDRQQGQGAKRPCLGHGVGGRRGGLRHRRCASESRTLRGPSRQGPRSLATRGSLGLSGALRGSPTLSRA
eukprot:4827698-Alexandrium_andersonii.AAC.1